MPQPLQVHEADGVTVTFDPYICIHAEECVRGLPEVFDPAQRRWIRPDRASPEAVRTAVARFPSGALRASPPAGGRPPDSVVTVSVTREGPLRLRARSGS